MDLIYKTFSFVLGGETDCVIIFYSPHDKNFEARICKTVEFLVKGLYGVRGFPSINWYVADESQKDYGLKAISLLRMSGRSFRVEFTGWANASETEYTEIRARITHQS
ncbi:hypothetical protein [Aquirhabdus sp.]|uniref:hypothetical protein n=1 Tax=Aquirhabdus sp. TaxID=2824160 RepID=UPI00396CC301